MAHSFNPMPGLTQDLVLRFLPPGPAPIPQEMRAAFRPAGVYLYEWRTYWVHATDADRLRVGDDWLEPLTRDLFPVIFENRLGLSCIQAYRDGCPLGRPLHVEVISPKFPDLDIHRRFYEALLNELFSAAAWLPFAIHSPTTRATIESTGPSSPFFAYHFLRAHSSQIRSALASLAVRPHREMVGRRGLVPASMASNIDADLVLTIAQNPEHWVKSSRSPLASRLNGHAPESVSQRLSVETADTPENRFVRMMVGTLLEACESLPRQCWWEQGLISHRETIDHLAGCLKETVHLDCIANASPLGVLPVQRLLRRGGCYSDLLQFWRCFQSARQPLFGAIDHALYLRDVAALYEYWVFFRLLEEMGSLVGLPVQGRTLDLKLSVTGGPGARAEARFGGAGTLLYNQSYAPAKVGYPSYSVPLRPDFTWLVDGRPDVVLDAKFRLDRPPTGSDEAETPEAAARTEDLYKMHAYRDALGVRAAVVLYPGAKACFYHASGKIDTAVRLTRLLDPGERMTGVGVIPLQPLLEGGGLE